DDVPHARNVARMGEDAVEFGTVARGTHQIDDAVHRLDRVVDATDIAVAGEARAQLRRDGSVVHRLRESAFLTHSEFVDHFLHAADRPDDTRDGDTVFL